MCEQIYTIARDYNFIIIVVMLNRYYAKILRTDIIGIGNKLKNSNGLTLCRTMNNMEVSEVAEIPILVYTSSPVLEILALLEATVGQSSRVDKT